MRTDTHDDVHHKAIISDWISHPYFIRNHDLLFVRY